MAVPGRILFSVLTGVFIPILVLVYVHIIRLNVKIRRYRAYIAWFTSKCAWIASLVVVFMLTFVNDKAIPYNEMFPSWILYLLFLLFDTITSMHRIRNVYTFMAKIGVVINLFVLVTINGRANEASVVNKLQRGCFIIMMGDYMFYELYLKRFAIMHE